MDTARPLQRISPEQGSKLLVDAGYEVTAPLIAATAVSSVADYSAQPGRVDYLDLEVILSDGLPPIDWLLHGWLMRKDIALLAGGGGIGKSTTAASLAMALVSGQEWCGIQPDGPIRVLHLDEEQGDADVARLFLRLGAPHPNLRVASMQHIRLDTSEGLARLEGAIADFRPELVIGDSGQQLFGATDENNATEIGLRYRELFRLRDTYETAFLLLHHKRKDQGFRVDALELVRGSTAHGTQCSTVWYASPASSDRLNLVQAKRRGAKKSSLIVVYSEESEDGPITVSSGGTVEDAETALERASEWITAHLADQGVAVRRVAIVDAGEKDGHKRATLERALGHLCKVKSIRKPLRGWYELHGPELEGKPRES